MEEQQKLQRSTSLALQLPRESFKEKGILDFPWGMRRGSNPMESELAAAVAATAFAIHSLEETRRESQRRMAEGFKDKRNTRTNTSASRRGSFELADTRSTMRRRSSENEGREQGREIMVRTSSLMPVERTGEEQRRVLTKAEAWERDELSKIDKKYRKMISKITEWENVKKMKAKLQLERKKAELERLSTLASLHHQKKREWIESAGRGARTQLEEMKRSKESNVQAKAKKVRSTGKIPVKCLCFERYR